MAKAFSLVVILLLSCLTIAEAQVWIDPATGKDGTQVQPQWRSNLDPNVDPYTDKETTRDRHRYLEGLRNQNNFGSGRSNGYNHNPYQFNPYQIRW